MLFIKLIIKLSEPKNSFVNRGQFKDFLQLSNIAVWTEVSAGQ